MYEAISSRRVLLPYNCHTHTHTHTHSHTYILAPASIVPRGNKTSYNNDMIIHINMILLQCETSTTTITNIRFSLLQLQRPKVASARSSAVTRLAADWTPKTWAKRWPPAGPAVRITKRNHRSRATHPANSTWPSAAIRRTPWSSSQSAAQRPWPVSEQTTWCRTA